MTDRGGSRGRVLAALSGVASALLGLGAAELVGAMLAPTASPVVVVGGLAIDLAPAWAKETAIALFGTADKIALIVGIAIVVLALAAAAGLLERVRPPWGRAVFGVFGVVGAIAAGTRAAASPLDVTPSLAAGLIAALTLGFLLRKLPEPRDAGPLTATASADRRRFLIWSGGAAAVGVLATVGGYAAASGRRAVTAARDAFSLPTPAQTAPAIPAGAELGIPDLSPVITPNIEFYRIDTALQVPSINPDEWSLRIFGMVENEITLPWSELIALPLEESVTTLICVSNQVGGDLIGNARWLGYPIRELLARAVPTADADMVLSRSIDGFTASTPIEILQDDRNAILAIGMNGEPLPAEHGFPVRMVVPGLYGYVSATKWVIELEVTRFDEARAYWTDRGWSPQGPVKIQSRIDVPSVGAIPPGPTTIAGVAWYQHTGIAAVDVQIGDGPWEPATLADAISTDTWVQWKYDWDATAGTYDVRVRATGTDGEVQTEELADVVPDGATGLHTRNFQVR